MNIAIASDHVGYEMKKLMIRRLAETGHAAKDLGCASGDHTDYPVFAYRAARAVMSGEYALGILICGTGVGMSLAANKVPGIRAAVCSEPYTARLTRLHNDANILCLGARVVAPEYAMMIVDEFLSADFEGGRHAQRVRMISAIERGEEPEGYS